MGNKKKWTSDEVEYLKKNRLKMKPQEMAKELNRTKASVKKKMEALGLTTLIKWTSEDEDYLISHYGSKSISELAFDLNRSESAIKSKAKLLGINTNKKNTWSDEDIKFVVDNYSHMSCKEISKVVGHSEYSVRDILRKKKLKKDSIGDYYWKDQDITLLKNNYQMMTHREMGELIGKTEESVRAKCFQLGLNKTPNWSKDEIDYLLNHTDLSFKELSSKLGRTVSAIALKSSKLGIKKSPYICNHSYFEKIDSNEKAYWLGLIYADGYISINKKTNTKVVGLELQISDKYMLEEFNKVIEGNYRITIRDRGCNISPSDKKFKSASLRIYSSKMFDDLINHKVLLNKTYKNEFPEVNDELFPSFIRGYFDGNGTIYYLKDSYKRLTFSLNSFNKEFLEWVNTKFLKLYGFKGYIYWVTGCWRLTVTKKEDCLTLYSSIYKNASMFLKRKFIKYDNYINH